MGEFRVRTYNGYNKEKYGQHPTELVFSVTGSEGAMVWRLSTGITPKTGPYTSGGSKERNLEALYNVNINGPTDMGLCAHSELNERTVHDDSPISESCEFLEGRACVCDYQTGLAGKELFPAFACEGFDGVKKILEQKYREHYGKDP
ncbi:hypothetical protein [Rhizobium phage RHph_X2_28B]|uniref:hypothetical protein n=1 Tax=Rhizobium phage RHph_X2_28B TaxID=2836086 RepID=UPI0023296D83|nr:hypothetical protein PP751_gp045 [Rhizobium phage RHph_X2_28B]QWY83497.1 hypothetical protein [Rhizobium phage RHph_X2_28B]QWY83733.1 hypothetical protein [Rhizobium phage RHph_X3_15]